MEKLLKHQGIFKGFIHSVLEGLTGMCELDFYTGISNKFLLEGTEFSDWFTRFWSSSTAQRASIQKRAEISNLTTYLHVKEKNNLSQNQILLLS